MTISAVLHAVEATPATVLNALELEKVAVAQSSLAEARADISLNNVIRQYLVPTMFEEFATASRSVKAALRD